MSYNTLSFIASTANTEEYSALEADFKSLSPVPQIRKIINPFDGIVAQYNLRENDLDEQEETLSANAISISKKNPEIKIAEITVDCFGGQCSSEGHILMNGEIVHTEEDNHIAHVHLLKQISEEHKNWHFEPFTREYFTKKGGIWGQVNKEDFRFFGISIYTKYKDQPGYRCDMTPNELILEKKGKFYIYLMEPFDKIIKILGSVLDDSDDSLTELQEIIKEEILYANSYVFIELLEKGAVIKLENMEGDEKTEACYRDRPFNERPLDLDNIEQHETSSESDTSEPFTEKKSFWNKLKGFFG